MRRILLDTDLAMGAPGSDIDDGFALALALAEPELELELVTTVDGNTDVDTATQLSIDLLGRLGRSDIPVVRGAADPLTARPGQPQAGIARRRPTVQRTRGTEPGHAAVRLADRVMSEPGELTIVAIGPLTNVALAMLLEPDLATSVQEVVVMGGVFLEHTNLAAMPGEFNLWSDPQAAQIVLDSGAPLRFVGLDVTRQVRLTRDHAAAMAREGGDFGRFASECTEGWITHKERTMPGDPTERNSCALHDPLAVAVVSHPELVSWRPAHVAIEAASRLTRGIAVADLLMSDQPPTANCEIAVAVDVDAFTAYFLDRMAALA